MDDSFHILPEVDRSHITANSGEICSVTMNAAKSVTATFNLSLINGVCDSANGQADIARECLKLNKNK